MRPALQPKQSGTDCQPRAAFPWALPLILVMGLLGALLVGSRDVSLGTDTSVYMQQYEYLATYGRLASTAPFAPGFNALSVMTQWVGFSSGGFLAVVAILQLTCWAVAIGLVNAAVQPSAQRRRWGWLASASLMLASPFFYAATVNVIRAGMAIALSLVAVGLLLQSRRSAFMAMGLLALLVHPTTAAVVLVAVGATWIFHGKHTRVVVLLLASAYLMGISDWAVSALPLEFVRNLAAGTTEGVRTGYQAGVRFDFMLAALAAWGVSVAWGRGKGPALRRLVDLQGALIIPFSVLGTVAYSDRLLLPFWLAMPITAGVLIAATTRPWVRVGALTVSVLFAIVMVGSFVSSAGLA